MNWTEILKYIRLLSINIMPFLHLETTASFIVLATQLQSVLECQDVTHNNCL